jgi:hypothetical protein
MVIEDPELVSDEDGLLTVRFKRRANGGYGWYLFWIIPIGFERTPSYEAEIAADGYAPFRFPIWNEFGETRHPTLGDGVRTKRIVEGREIWFLVY